MENKSNNSIELLIFFNDSDSFQLGIPSQTAQVYQFPVKLRSNCLIILNDWLNKNKLIKKDDNISYKIKETFLKEFEIKNKNFEELLKDMVALTISSLQYLYSKYLMKLQKRRRNTLNYQKQITQVDKQDDEEEEDYEEEKFEEPENLSNVGIRSRCAALKKPKTQRFIDNNDIKQMMKTRIYEIRMNGNNHILELQESQMGQQFLGVIRNQHTDHISMQFQLKHNDKVYIDTKFQIFKLGYGSTNVKFFVKQTTAFNLLIKVLKSNNSVQINFIEFDSFNEREEVGRKITIQKEIRQILKSEVYEVYSIIKNSWKSRRLSKKLIVEDNGKITLFGETEDTKDSYLLKEIQQIIWNNASQTSNPLVTFTFKDEKNNFDIFFEIEDQCNKFLKHAADIIKRDVQQRRDMFIVKQSSALKRKSRIIKQYEWFQTIDPNSKNNTRMSVQHEIINKELLTAPTEKYEPLDCQIIYGNDEKGQREEDVEWESPNEVIFKVILTELNIERKRYLLLNRQEKFIQILKSSNKKVQYLVQTYLQAENFIHFNSIINVQRSLTDHRQIMIKVVAFENILLLTFSSAYKLLQFLELYNFYSSIYQQIPDPQIMHEEQKSIDSTQANSPPQSISTPYQENLRILIISYNMNRKLQNVDMEKLFHNASQYDIIIFGGQEAKMTQKTSIIIEIANFLGKSKFLTVQTVQMWEMFLVGFIRLDHVPYLKNTQSSYKATGVGNILGNKGGLQMSFRLYDYLFNFINVHLIHGAKNFEKRNEMMSDLLRKMRNQREELDADVISDFSYILGDFNYRMEGSFETILSQMDDIVELREKYDQLYKAIKEYDKYPNYQEFDIKFKPTYKRNKFDSGFFNKKNQSPSYTDRILFKNNAGNKVQLHQYNSFEDIMGSDHRPVMLDMCVSIKPVHYLKLQQLLDPTKAISQGVGILKFRSLSLKNLKQHLIEQYLKKKMYFPMHLQISFYADFLETFASSCEISIFNTAQFYTDFTWEQKDLPICYTPINSLDLIKDKRIIILIWLTNEVCNQEVIGQVNLNLDCLEFSPEDNVMKGYIDNQKVIIANTLVGRLEGEFQYYISDGTKGRKQSASEPNSRRKKANNLIKFVRDHSV